MADVIEFQRQISCLTNQIDDKICEHVSELRHQMIMFNSVIHSTATAAESNLQNSHNYIANLKNNWTLLEDFSWCMKIHINNASKYHLFHQNLCEYQKLMAIAMTEARIQFRTINGEDGVEHFYENIQKNLTVFLQWWQRIDNVIVQSRTLLPIGLRRNPIDLKQPAKMLISFKTDKIALNENEDIFVCKSIDRDHWEIENLRGIKDVVPSICVQLCGPETEGIEQAVSLRLALMNNWTVTLKELSKSLIKFVQIKVMGYSNAAQTDCKIDILHQLNVIEEMLQTLDVTSCDFDNLHEKVHGVRVALGIYSEEEIVDDETIIEINDMFLQVFFLAIQSQNIQNEDLPFQEQQQYVTQLIKKYAEFIKFWEMYKMLIDTSNNPNYFWMIEDLHKLKSFNISELFNFISKEDKDVWTSYINLLSVQDGRKTKATNSKIDSSIKSPLHFNKKNRWSSTQSFQLEAVNRLQNSSLPYYSSNIELQKSTDNFAERNCLSWSNNTFGGSWNNKATGFFGLKKTESDKDSVFLKQESNEYLKQDFQDEKVVISEHISKRRKSRKVVTKQYVPQIATQFSSHASAKVSKKLNHRLSNCSIRDALTDESYSLQQAITMGIINEIEDTYYDRLAQIRIPISMALMKGYIVSPSESELTKSLSNGIIAILNGSYEKSDIVKSILDKKDGIQKSIDEAKLLGLTNQSMSSFVNTLTGRRLNFDQAVSESLITIDFKCNGLSTYLVYSVMDSKRNKKINFREALDWGVLNADKGCYVNCLTGEHLEIMEAIQNGFITADLIQDVNKIQEIASENRLIIYDSVK